MRVRMADLVTKNHDFWRILTGISFEILNENHSLLIRIAAAAEVWNMQTSGSVMRSILKKIRKKVKRKFYDKSKGWKRTLLRYVLGVLQLLIQITWQFFQSLYVVNFLWKIIFDKIENKLNCDFTMTWAKLLRRAFSHFKRNWNVWMLIFRGKKRKFGRVKEWQRVVLWMHCILFSWLRQHDEWRAKHQHFPW